MARQHKPKDNASSAGPRGLGKLLETNWRRRGMALQLARQAWANGFAMANSKAGLLVLSSVAIYVLLPRLAAALNPIEEYELGYGIVSFVMKSPRGKGSLYHFLVPATGITETEGRPREWTPWTSTGIFVNQNDCYMIKASGSVHTSLKRLLTENDSPAVTAVLSPKYVGPSGSTEIEETPYQRYLKQNRLYPGSEVGYGGLIYRIKSNGSDQDSMALPVGKGGKKAFHAHKSGELEFAINDISLRGLNNEAIKRMYLPPPPNPLQPCATLSILHGQGQPQDHYCIEALYSAVGNQAFQGISGSTDRQLTMAAVEKYKERRSKWETLLALASIKNQSVSQLVPDLWYKENAGGLNVTVKIADVAGQCPQS